MRENLINWNVNFYAKKVTILSFAEGFYDEQIFTEDQKNFSLTFPKLAIISAEILQG